MNKTYILNIAVGKYNKGDEVSEQEISTLLNIKPCIDCGWLTEKQEDKPLLPPDAKDVEVFHISSKSEAFIGFKISNGNFEYVQVPFNPKPLPKKQPPVTTRPPIGIIPKYLWQEHRYNELNEAILRYSEDGKGIPLEWIAESYELQCEINNRQSKSIPKDYYYCHGAKIPFGNPKVDKIEVLSISTYGFINHWVESARNNYYISIKGVIKTEKYEAVKKVIEKELNAPVDFEKQPVLSLEMCREVIRSISDGAKGADLKSYLNTEFYLRVKSIING